MLADGPADARRIEPALARLAGLSLVFRFPDGSAWAHRWTAQGLAAIDDPAAHAERCHRAGRYRWWRVENQSHDLGDAVEAVRNFLAGCDFDAAVSTATACFAALRRFQQSVGIAALASEVLESLPSHHLGYAAVADDEAQAHLALGLTERALERYEALREAFERRSQAEPDRADYQRDLSVSYERMGDLYRALGQGDQARDAYLKALAIAERLAQAEPDRADYQRDLAISLSSAVTASGSFAREPIERALAILLTLQQAGRLVPGHESKIAALRDLLGSEGTE